MLLPKEMIQSCHSHHNELSWHVQNCDMVGSLQSELEQEEFLLDFNHDLKTVYEWSQGLVSKSCKSLNMRVFEVSKPQDHS